MKFGKSLSNQIEEALPEWRDKFLSYKDLKKRLKLIDPSSAIISGVGERRPVKRPRLEVEAVSEDGPAAAAAAAAAASSSSMAEEEEEEKFMRLLEAELEKFNSFFEEKEEEYVIRQKDLQDRLRTAKDSKEELMKVRKEIVDLHGEMVLLENYSALNYTGLVKILKKYDKRTGALIRLPFIQKVLQQPFFTTDLLYKLVKECENMLDCLLPANKPSVTTASSSFSSSSGGEQGYEQKKKKTGSALVRGGGGMPELEEIEYMESLYMKSTVSALRTLKEIRSGSSTVSIFSLPPLQSNNVVEDRWGKIPLVEQAAK